MRYLKINDWINPKVLFKISVAGVIILIILPVIKHIIFEFLKDKSEGAIFFSNIATPVITAFALIVYYLSLQQLKEQNNHLRNEVVFKDISSILDEKYIYYDSYDLSDILSLNNEERKCSILTLYRGEIIRLFDKIRISDGYKKKQVPQEYKHILDADYRKITNIFYHYEDFLSDIILIINTIENNNDLTSTHRKRLIHRIARQLLPHYFKVIKHKRLLFDLWIPDDLNANNVKYFHIFDKHPIDDIFDFYKKQYPDILNEIMYKKAYI